jgi:hypothetical protein
LDLRHVALGEGWSLVIDSDFHRAVNPDGSLSAWDGDRTIDIHVSRVETVGGHLVPPREMLGMPVHDQHLYRREEAGLEGYADLRQDSDESGPIFRLATTTASDNRLISVWCAFRDMKHLEWALDTWNSIKHDGSPVPALHE